MRVLKRRGFNKKKYEGAAEKIIQERNKYEEVLKRKYSRKSEKKRIQEKKGPEKKGFKKN